ncbi:Transcription factor bye1 [Yamadazyma tenuis]|nr:Transcription factor bye1 [Yamadazyma tenuis]
MSEGSESDDDSKIVTEAPIDISDDDEYVESKSTKRAAADDLLEEDDSDINEVDNLDTPAPATAVQSHKIPIKRQKTYAGSTTLKDKVRANVAKAFMNVLKTQLPDDYKDDGVSSKEDVALKWSMSIEAAIFNVFPQKDRHYTDKSRGIMTLLKKPNVLQRLKEKTLTFEKLVASSPEEIDDDLKKYAEKVRQESIRRSVLTSHEGQRIRRTHKGDEIVEDFSDTHRQEDNDVSIVSKSVDHRRFEDAEAENAGDDGAAAKEETQVGAKVYSYSTAGLDDDDDAYGGSDNESVESVGQGVGSPDLDEDAELDKILQEPKPKADPPPPRVEVKPMKSALKKSSQLPPTLSTNIWEGRITFPDFTTFTAKAQYISSSNYHIPRTPLDVKFHNNCINVSKEIFAKPFYDIEGRLDRVRADPYLKEVVTSRDIYLFKLTPVDEFDDYDKLFNYLLSRAKVGVLSGKPHFAKDAYVIALDNNNVPPYLSNFEEFHDRRGLFALYVVKKDYVSAKGQTKPPPRSVKIDAPPKASEVQAPKQSQEPSILDSILSKLGGPAGAPSSNSGSGPNLPPKPTFQAPTSQQIDGMNPAALTSDQMGLLSSIVSQNPQVQSNPQAMLDILTQQQQQQAQQHRPNGY